MSRTIDEKVVSMQFDNSKFEGNVKTTMSTLDKLKQSLNFKGATKGLEKMEAATRTVDFSKMEFAATRAGFHIQDVWEKVTRYIENNIAHRIVTAGQNMAKALTVDPVKTGFNEYELKMDSIRTILNSTGEPLERVNKLLNELNTYSDETIYSFQDMTQNIGKFTNAGVKLDDAVLAIKGISNEAAVSGANANEASRAMYNFAQALSAGYVKLIDWKSIENANMATVEFKQQLIDTAVACGTLTKTSDGMYATSKRNISATQNFNDSLQDQWMTSEVLIETLKRYSDKNTEIGKKAYAAAQEVTKLTQMWDVLKETAQSGWAQTWELIIGNMNQAKAIFTPLTNFFSSIIDRTSKFRNDVLETALGVSAPIRAIMDKLSGVKDIADKVSGSTEAMSGAMKSYGEIVDQVIRGEWSNGQARWDKLTESGYNWAKVQNLVNEKLGSTVRHAEGASEAEGKLEKQTKSLTDAELKKMGMTDSAIDAYRKQERISNSLSDAKLKELGLTETEIKLYRELEEEYIRTGVSMEELYEKTTGRSLMIESLKNLGQSLVTVFKTVGKAWNDVINGGKSRDQVIADTADKIRYLILVLHDFSERVLVLAKARSNDFTRTFRGLFAAIQLVSNLVGGGLKIAFKVIGSILGMFNIDILDITANIGDAIVALNDWVKAHDPLTKVLEKLEPYIKKAVIAIKDWIEVNQPFTKAIETITSGLKQAKDAITDWIQSIKNGEKTPKQVAKEIIEIFGYLGSFISSAIKTLINNVKDGFQKIPEYMTSGLSNGILDKANFVLQVIAELGKMMLEKIKEVLGIHSPSREMYEIGKNFIQGFINGVKETIPKIPEIIKDLFSKLIEFVKNLDFGEIFAISMGVGLIGAIKTINKTIDLLSAPFEGLGNLLNSASNFVNNFSKTVTKLGKSLSFSIKVKAIKELAIAIAIMVGAFAVLTLLDSSKFLPALGVMAAMVAMVGTLAAIAGKFGPKNIKQFSALSVAILSISGSLMVVAIALKLLSKADPKGLAIATTSLIAIMSSLIALIIVFEAMPKGFSPKKIEAFSSTINAFAKLMLKLSVSLLIMAFVVKLLGKMKPSVLGQGLGAMVAFVAIVGVLTLITKLGGKDIEHLGNTLLKMSVAIGIMAMIVGMLGKMKPSTIGRGLTAMLGFVAIIGVLTLITKLGGKQISEQLGKTLMAMAVAIGILGLTVKLLGSIPKSQLEQGYKALWGFVAIIGVLTLIVRLIGPAEMAKVGATILSMSIAIGILAGVSILLGLISIPNLVKGITVVGTLSLFMIGLIRATKGVNDCKGNLIAMAIVIATMTACVGALCLIKPAKLAKAVLALSILMGMFALMTYAAGKLKKNTIAVLGLMTGVVIVLAGLLILLAKLPIKNSLAAAVSLGILMTAFSGSMHVLSKFTKSKVIDKSVMKTLGILLGVMAGLALILGLLCTFSKNINQSIKASIALSILMASFTGSMSILSKFTKTKVIDKSVMETMGILLGVMAGLALVLGLLCSFATNLNMAITAATALSILLVVMTGCMLILSQIRAVSFIGIIAIALLGLVVGELANILSNLCTYGQNLDSAIEVAIALSILLVTMTGALALIGALTSVLATAALGVPVFGFVVAELAGVLAALGKLSQIEGLTWFIDEGGELLCQLGNILGRAISSIIGGIGEGISASLVQIGDNLSEFMKKATPFIEGCKLIDGSVAVGAGILYASIMALTAADLFNNIVTFLSGGASLADLGSELSKFMRRAGYFIETSQTIDPAKMEGCKAIAEMIMILTAADLLDSLTSWFSGGISFAELGTQLSDFGPGLAKFAESVKGIDGEAVKAAAEAGKAIAGMAKAIPNEGGWAAKMFGDNSLSTFAPQMKTLGENLKAFSDSTSGIVYENIEDALKAAKAIIEMANDIPNEGSSVASFFVGDNSLGKFALQMPTLGGALKVFSDSASGIVYENIEGALKAAKAIIKMAKDIPNEGSSVASLFVGDNSLATFAPQIPKLGRALERFSESTSGIVYENIVGALQTAKAIIKMANDIPNQGDSVAKFFVGDNSLCKFALQMPTLGNALKDFSKSTSGIIYENIVGALNVSKAIIEMAHDIPNEGGLAKLFAGDNSLGSFAPQMEKLGEALKGFSESVAGVDTGKMSASIANTGLIITVVNRMSSMDASGLETFVTSITVLAESDIETFIDAFGDIYAGSSIKTIDSLITSINSMTGLDPSGISGFKMALDNLSKVSLDEFVATFDGSASRAASAVSNLMNGLIGAVTLKKYDFIREFNDMVSSSILSLTNRQSSFVLAGQSIMNTLALGIRSAGNSGFAGAFDGIINAMVLSITTKQALFTVAGQSVMSAFITGITSNGNGNLYIMFNNMITNVLMSLDNKAATFLSAGKNLMTNFTNGITSGGSTSLSTAFASIINMIQTSITSKEALFMMAGRNLINSFVSGVNDGQSNILSIFTMLVTNCHKMITNNAQLFKTAGQSLILMFDLGIIEKQGTVKKTIASVVANSYNVLTKKYSDFKNAGSYLVDGFCDGIDENTWQAEARAAAMAEAALEAAKEALGINSPSKEFYKVGNFAGQGLVNAMNDYAGRVEKSGKNMGDSAKKGLSNTIAKLKSMLDSDMDSSPTIRPVLDLSNIQSGMGSLSGMFSGMNGFTLQGSVAMAQQTGASMNNRHSSLAFENKMNDEIVKLNESISGLRDDMAKQYDANQTPPEVNLFMDSRKVASSLAKPMDKELNLLAKRRN